MIKLGNKCRDLMTGYAGTAVSRTEWLYGCARIGIESPNLDKDGKVQAIEYFDEQRVEVVAVAEPVVSPDSSAGTGGPRPAPSRNEDPTASR